MKTAVSRQLKKGTGSRPTVKPRRITNTSACLPHFFNRLLEYFNKTFTEADIRNLTAQLKTNIAMLKKISGNI